MVSISATRSSNAGGKSLCFLSPVTELNPPSSPSSTSSQPNKLQSLSPSYGGSRRALGATPEVSPGFTDWVPSVSKAVMKTTDPSSGPTSNSTHPGSGLVKDRPALPYSPRAAGGGTVGRASAPSVTYSPGGSSILALGPVSDPWKGSLGVRRGTRPWAAQVWSSGPVPHLPAALLWIWSLSISLSHTHMRTLCISQLYSRKFCVGVCTHARTCTQVSLWTERVSPSSPLSG